MSAKNGAIKLVSGNSNPALAQEIAMGLDLPLMKALCGAFPIWKCLSKSTKTCAAPTSS